MESTQYLDLIYDWMFNEEKESLIELMDNLTSEIIEKYSYFVNIYRGMALLKGKEEDMNYVSWSGNVDQAQDFRERDNVLETIYYEHQAEIESVEVVSNVYSKKCYAFSIKDFMIELINKIDEYTINRTYGMSKDDFLKFECEDEFISDFMYSKGDIKIHDSELINMA